MGYFEKQEKVEIVLKKLSLSLLLVSSALMAEESEATKARNMTYLVVASQWEVGATLNYAWEGEETDPMHNALGVGIRGAYRFLDNWCIAAEYDYWGNVDGGEQNGIRYGHTDIHRYIGSISADFFPEKRQTPYLIGGAGYEHYTNAARTTHKDGLITVFGAGYRYKVTEELSLTGEARFRTHQGDILDNGFIWSLGLNYHFLKPDEETEELRLQEQQR